MSRSRKKHPYIKHSGKSDKKSKILAHRSFRAREKACLHQLEFIEVFPKYMREVSDTWSFPSDGLACYESHPCNRMMRK